MGTNGEIVRRESGFVAVLSSAPFQLHSRSLLLGYLSSRFYFQRLEKLKHRGLTVELSGPSFDEIDEWFSLSTWVRFAFSVDVEENKGALIVVST